MSRQQEEQEGLYSKGISNAEAQASSVEKATQVLDLSSNSENSPMNGPNSRASCEPYGHPVIFLINGTQFEMTIGLNVTVRTCANPPVDRIIWELPSGQLLKPGQQSSGSELQSWISNSTCSDLQLFAASPGFFLPAGRHLILSKNRLGYAQVSIDILEGDSSTNFVHSATIQSGQCDTAHFQQSALILMTIWTSYYNLLT